MPRFCSRNCAQRFRNWKNPKKLATGRFLASVSEAIWLDSDEKRVAGEKLVRAGTMIGLRRKGRLVVIGLPLPDGALRSVLPLQERRALKRATRYKTPANSPANR